LTPDDGATWSIDGSDGELRIHTGVAGPAAAVGHRLTIAMRRWRATVQWHSGEPVDGVLSVEVGSLDVVRGEGGVTPLLGPEKILIRRNALTALDAEKFSRILFSAKTIEQTDDGYQLTGELTIHGRKRPQVVQMRTDDEGDRWRLSSDTVITQSDFGITPYSQLLGAVKVADDVTVSFSASVPKTVDERA
jgi:polyisoprenoid-binding protein YceI